MTVCVCGDVVRWQVSELCGRDAAHEAAATLRALGHDISLELAAFLLYLGYVA
jgi:hypothetical protein